MSAMVSAADYYKETVGYDSDILPGTECNRDVDPSKSNVGTMPGAWGISALACSGEYLRGWESNPIVWQPITKTRYLYQAED